MGRRAGLDVLMGKISSPPGFVPRTVQPVASRYTDRAIPAHIIHTAVNTIPEFFRMYETSIKHAKPLNVEGTGKAIPVQAWEGPEGSRSLRLPDCRRIGT
jgi:hypothetical protein